MSGIPNNTVVVCLLDETGSMLARRQETIVAYNSFVNSLREESGQTIFIQTLKFDRYSNEPVVRPLTTEAIPVRDAPTLGNWNYVPRGNTPLYDACGLAVAEAERIRVLVRATRVTLMIQTDGEENASREFSHSTITELLAHKKDAGWNILFLASDLAQTGYAVSRSLGLNAGQTMSYTTCNSNAAFASAARTTRNYGATGQSTGFTDEEKTKSGDMFGRQT